ncbi:MAG: helix-turn-helix domain-containing protein, partial [Chloroflexota bacterium]|nr:helix-turn-helix domain-containing protein [Chloroflexota bacterium]
RILRMRTAPPPMSTIAATLAVGPATVQQVRTRSRQAGLDAALHERPRSGHPRRLTARVEASITTLAWSTPPPGHGLGVGGPPRWACCRAAHWPPGNWAALRLRARWRAVRQRMPVPRGAAGWRGADPAGRWRVPH